MRHGVVIALLIQTALFSEVLYVRSLKINSYAKPDYKSQKIGELVRGAEVEKLEETPSWVRIRFSSQEAWVPSLALGKAAALDRVSILTTREDLSATARKRASSYSSTLAARGLAESGRKRISSQQMPDFDAIDKLEKNQVPESEGLEFITKDEK